MNKIFKKSAIGLAILSLAGISYAGSFSGFFGGIEGAYLQGRNNDLAYVFVSPITPTGNFSTTSIPLNNHEYGWRLYGGMKLGPNDDMTASYLRFHTNNAGFIQNPISATPGVTPVGLSTPRWLFSDEWTHINAHVTFNLDDYYAVVGHTVALNAWNVRFAGGFEYARLDSDMSVAANFALAPFSALPPAGYTAKSELRGFGPRIELDATYNLPFGLSVFADANGALLMGHRIISLNSMQRLGPPAFLPSFGFDERYPVVPKVGLKLGFGSAKTFGQAGGEGHPPTTTFSMQAGWMVESYIHAIERPDASRLAGGSVREPISPVTNDLTKTSNYDYQGPFLTLQIGTDWI